VEKPVLLDEVISHRDFDVDLTRLDAQQASADRRHEVLSLEAGAHTRLE
jgi:hypothetical protein